MEIQDGRSLAPVESSTLNKSEALAVAPSYSLTSCPSRRRQVAVQENLKERVLAAPGELERSPREASGGSLQDGAQTIKLCTLGVPQQRRHCFVGAVKDFILTHADPQRDFSFCRTLDTAYKQSCYAAVGEVLFSLYPDTAVRSQACASAEEEYRAVCKAAAHGS